MVDNDLKKENDELKKRLKNLRKNYLQFSNVIHVILIFHQIYPELFVSAKTNLCAKDVQFGQRSFASQPSRKTMDKKRVFCVYGV